MSMLPTEIDKGGSRSVSVASGLVDGIANWCDALNGGVSLQQALTGLISALGAEAGMIVRTHRSDFQPIAIAAHDMRANHVGRPLRMSFADGYFGAAMRMPRTASIWQGSLQGNESGPDCSPALREWQAPRGLKEFVVVLSQFGAAPLIA